MFFKKRKGKRREEDNILEIPIVHSYKYLGIILDEKMLMEEHLEYIRTKTQKAIKLVQILRWKRTSTWKQLYA